MVTGGDRLVTLFETTDHAIPKLKKTMKTMKSLYTCLFLAKNYLWFGFIESELGHELWTNHCDWNVLGIEPIDDF